MRLQFLVLPERKVVGRDVIDEEFIHNVKTNTGITHDYYQDRSKNSRYINYYSNVSSTPLKTHPDDRDTDKDGMPDVWENIRGFNPSKQDHNLDSNNNGYTNLEEFINLIDF